jgi:hypothetical protein
MAPGSTHLLTKMSTRNFPGGKGQPARKSDKLTAICEPIVWTKCESLDVSQPYRPSRPITRIALPFFNYFFLYFHVIYMYARSGHGTKEYYCSELLGFWTLPIIQYSRNWKNTTFLVSRIPDDGQSPKTEQFWAFTPSSELFRIINVVFLNNKALSYWSQNFMLKLLCGNTSRHDNVWINCNQCVLMDRCEARITCSSPEIRVTHVRQVCHLIHNSECANWTELWMIWGFHSGDYEECRLLGCGAV